MKHKPEKHNLKEGIINHVIRSGKAKFRPKKRELKIKCFEAPDVFSGMKQLHLEATLQYGDLRILQGFGSGSALI
jgi:hypothetical protein